MKMGFTHQVTSEWRPKGRGHGAMWLSGGKAATVEALSWEPGCLAPGNMSKRVWWEMQSKREQAPISHVLGAGM